MSADGAEVLCVGETMAVLLPAVHGVPTDVRVTVGGAESNVAVHLATQGIRVSWASRRGDDAFGTLVEAELTAAGVDVTHLERDLAAPTGAYLKERLPSTTRVTYYRAGSAASRMSPAFVDALPLPAQGWVHVSGVTPAISTSAAAAVERLFDRARDEGVRMSFDVNHRPALWRERRADAELLRLSLLADVVLVGRDEAEHLWGTPTTDAVAALLSSTPLLVVKDAEHEAVEFDRRGAITTRTAEPATPADVVEAVGAGDAFAGGYLAGLLRGEAAPERLRRAHRAAAWTLGSVDDVRPGHRPEPFAPASGTARSEGQDEP